MFDKFDDNRTCVIVVYTHWALDTWAGETIVCATAAERIDAVGVAMNGKPWRRSFSALFATKPLYRVVCTQRAPVR